MKLTKTTFFRRAAMTLLVMVLTATAAWAQVNTELTEDGRRIANGQKPTAKGVYIVNGRKVVIK